MTEPAPGSHPGYEPPAIRTLGSVHGLTQMPDKQYGSADGFTFMGVSITNASP
jgi:hypothetical protein